MRALLLIPIAAAGCATDFEDPSIVLDLRILAVSADPPEVVADVESLDASALDEIDPVTVCALVADPGADRELTYELTACPPTESGRCDDPSAPFVALAPSDSDPACAILYPSFQLASVIERSVRADALAGFGGIGVQVSLRVTPGGDREAAELATKRVLYSPRFPEGRVANTNPAVDVELEVDGDGGAITFTPAEPDGVRESYLLPTLDGGVRSFTENLSYAWFATSGRWSAETTGGPVDIFGNTPALETTWTPGGDEAADMWVVVRDERGGTTWHELERN